MALTARRHHPDDTSLRDVLTLIQTAFAYMDGVVDPPSSVHRLTLDHLRAQCTSGEVWSLGAPVHACVLLTPKPDALYIGKLAVAPSHRGRGLARELINLAQTRATGLGLPRLELKSRIELSQNHAVFTALGFHEARRTTHPGYIRPTSILFYKDLP